MKTKFRLCRALGFAVGLVLLLSACEEESDLPEMRIQSAGFGQMGLLPFRFTCRGKKSPPLSFSVPPEETRSLVVIMEDPGYISGTRTHMLIWGLPARSIVAEDIQNYPPPVGVLGLPDRVADGASTYYDPPCPGDGETHEYHFYVYAMDRMIDLPPKSRREALDAAMKGHILAKGELVGLVESN